VVKVFAKNKAKAKKMANTGILTGQYVRIDQPTASAGDRLIAQLIDWGLQLCYLLFMVWIMNVTGISSGEFVFWAIVMPITFYPLLCEVFNKGQTIGKMVRKMRVVMLDGASPSLGALVLRWLLVVVDGPLLAYMGILFILLSRHRQRLGDMAAGTVVIKLQSYDRSRMSLGDYDYLSSGYRPQYAAAAELSAEQVDLIRRTLESDNAERIDMLAAKVAQTLGIRQRETYTDLFLQQVLRDYHYYALEAV
jgi:uncharacterized RDD family membrane protein YckC